jgi:hypothetical protein
VIITCSSMIYAMTDNVAERMRKFSRTLHKRNIRTTMLQE